MPRQLTKPSQRTPPSPSPRRRAPSESLLDWVLLGPGSQESSISNKKAYKAKLEKVSGAEWAGWWWKFGKLCCFGGSNPCFPINFPLSQWVEGHFFEGICLTERGLELAWDLGSKMAVRGVSPDGNSWQTWFLLIFAHAFVTHFLDTLPILSWFWKEQGFQPKRTTGSVAVCYPPAIDQPTSWWSHQFHLRAPTFLLIVYSIHTHTHTLANSYVCLHIDYIHHMYSHLCV